MKDIFQEMIENIIKFTEGELLFNIKIYKLKAKLSPPLIKWYWKCKFVRAINKKRIFDKGLHEVIIDKGRTNKELESIIPLSENTAQKIIKNLKKYLKK
ncbi:MAG: hypothetical protein WCQ63_04540, partial [Methanomethylophilus sp.]